MWKGVAISGFCLLFSLMAISGNGNLEIQLANKDTIKVMPGSTSNIVVKLINNTSTHKDFLLKVNSPQGWKCLTNFGTVPVEKESNRIKILSIYVPEFTKAGDYEISVDAYDEFDKHKIGTINIKVYVQAKYEILVTAYQAPAYVVSGDTLSVKFMLQNLSNVETTINTTIKNYKESDRQIFTLAPDSFITVRRTFVTEKNVLQYKKQNISFNASISEYPEINSSKYHFYDVVPSNKNKFDPYNRFPVMVTPLFITGNRSGKREYAFMLDVFGVGMLNNKKGNILEFHFRGPNRRGESLLGIYDEYYVRYMTPKSKIIVGDNNYSLSYLTEFSRYGRGVGYEHTFKKISVGSFINYPRFYPQVKRVASVYANYLSEKKYELNAGYLNKQFVTDTSAHLFTISGVASPYKWVDLELEYATGLSGGKFTRAYKTAIKSRYSFFSVFFNYTFADKDFPGYFSSSKYLGTGASARITKRINVNFGYSFNHNNIALDTLFNNAPYSENFNFSVNYSIAANTSMSVTLSQRERDDRMNPKKFHYNEKTIRVSISQKVNRIKINLRGEMGDVTNYLTMKEGQKTGMYKANLTLGYKINNHISFKGFVNYNSQKLYSVDDNLNWYYGCSVDASLGKKLLVNLNYRNNYEIEEYYRDRSIFNLNANYEINNNHKISTSVRYNLARNTLDQREFEVMLKYAYTINVPVSKKDDLGTLTGKVINNGVDNIEGIVFTLGGNIAVTDENGLFNFPIVQKGLHYLIMDYSNAGIFAIAETPGPYKLDILPGIDNYFEIALVKSAIIRGSLIIEDDENKGKRDFVEVKVKLNKLIIEAKKDAEVYRVLTDDNGDFSFEGLRPGIWKMRVYKNGIPKEYELLTEFLSVSLKSGQDETIEVKLRKKQRRIKFQTSPASKIKNTSKVVKKPIKAKVEQVPPSTTSLSDIEYRVQIIAKKGEKIPKEELANRYNLSLPIYEDAHNEYYIYTVGKFQSYREANKLNQELKSVNNISNAFVVKFKNGKRQ